MELILVFVNISQRHSEFENCELVAALFSQASQVECKFGTIWVYQRDGIQQVWRKRKKKKEFFFLVCVHCYESLSWKPKIRVFSRFEGTTNSQSVNPSVSSDLGLDLLRVTKITKREHSQLTRIGNMGTAQPERTFLLLRIINQGNDLF